MRDEYDFSDSKRNPYAKQLKEHITLELGKDVIAYFKTLAEETGVSHEHLINSYLQECARKARKPKLVWDVD